MAFSVLCYFLIISLWISIWFLRKHLRQRAAIEEFAGPRTYFPFGNVHQFKTDSRDWLDQGMGCSLIYANSMRIFRIWLFLQPYLVINGAEEAEAILGSNKHNDKSYEY